MQTLHARKKFEERLHTLERQKIDIEESLVELRTAIALHRRGGRQGQAPAPSAHAAE